MRVNGNALLYSALLINDQISLRESTLQSSFVLKNECHKQLDSSHFLFVSSKACVPLQKLKRIFWPLLISLLITHCVGKSAQLAKKEIISVLCPYTITISSLSD